ncbi:MAG: YceI family protein [Acidimicrobiales bacterium]|jgi:polyisoprenoid-binding protein YceI
MTSPDDGAALPTFVERRPTGGSVPVIPAGHWVVDPTRSSIGFVAKHLLVSKVTGTFTRVAGSIHVTADPSDSSVQAIADATSVTTGDAARDEHLRSAAFFDVERWPTLTLAGQGLRSRAGRHVLDARLTIRDVSHPVVFEVTATNLHTGSGLPVGTAQADGRRTARFTADALVNRKDFGLRWNAAIETGAVVVGDMVALAITAVAELAP